MRKDRILLKPILINLKINGCAICGGHYRLQFHHTNPEDKNFHINLSMTPKTNIEIANELNKCILLCQSCHLKTHWDEKMIDKVSKCKTCTQCLNTRMNI